MDSENKAKTTKQPKMQKGRAFYLVLSLTIAAAGFGTWGAVRGTLPNANEMVKEQSTIDWDNYVTRPTEAVTSAEQANASATGVADPRDTAVTTAIEAANAPYTGSFAMPFGTKVTKDYSGGEMVKSATMGDWRVHDAVDFSGEKDGKVLAIQDGTVQSVKNDPLLGVVVTIDHGNGMIVKYCGLSENSTVQTGADVSKGEEIGIIGQVPCESTEGTHLHLEIAVNGKVADPLKVMNKAD
ncbi:MAG: M23 family metallopeptidase [Oscillospiraceae bacterium]|jgi:murein DD-endopeptidase MepM/ murein hydrolase activator NlpD|nr:M23 family metallopeptidase [Oscillospiraceae bacterium]